MFSSLLQMAKKVGLSNNGLGSGVGDDELDLLRLKQRIHRPRPCADFETCEIKDEILGTICEQQTHPIAFAYAKRKQSSGGAIHFIVECAISEHAAAGFQNEKLFVRCPLDLRLEQFAYVFGRSEERRVG